MKVIMENWRSFLAEVTFAQAKEILDSKRTKKIIKAYQYEKEGVSPLRGGDFLKLHRNFKRQLSI